VLNHSASSNSIASIMAKKSISESLARERKKDRESYFNGIALKCGELGGWSEILAT